MIMNKFTRLITLLAVLILATATFAQSESDQGLAIDELSHLARYVPENTPFFVTARTDDAYIDKLQGFLNTIITNWDLPVEELPVKEGIHGLASIPFDGYPEQVETWLGDRVGLAISSFYTATPTFIYTIKDQASADAFLTDHYDNTYRSNLTYKRSVHADGIITYTVQNWANTTYIEITDNVMIVSGQLNYLDMLSEETLKDREEFNSLIDELPADHYDILGYFELSAIVDAYNTVVYGNDHYYDDDHLDLDHIQFQQAAIAVNLYENRVFVLDSVTYQEGGIASQPLDLDLLRFVPSNALFVWQTTTLGASLEQFNHNFSQAFTQFERFGGGFDDDIPFNPVHILTFLQQAFKGTTGIRPEALAEGLNDDWLFYVSSVGNTFNFLNLIRSSDTEITQPVVNHLTDSLVDIFAGSTYEDDILKFSLPINPVFGDQEIWIGQQDQLIVAGTEHDFKFEPDPTSVTLNTRRHYNEASAYFLSDLNTLFYLNFGQIQSLLGVLRQSSSPIDAREIADVINLLNGFESLTLNASSQGDYIQSRFTLTLTGSEG